MKPLRNAILLAAAAAALAASATGAAFAVTPGGTVIDNQAHASYLDASGLPYQTQSNEVSVTVFVAAAIAVAPKETAPNGTETVPQGQSYSRTFTISNVGNVVDAYIITAATVGQGSISSIDFIGPGNTLIPVTIGTTVSPPVAPNGTMQVVINADTTGVAIGTVIPVDITAQETVQSPRQSDSGQMYAVIAAPPTIVNPLNPALPIDKFVDGQRSVQVAPGATVHYSIPFIDNGATSISAVDLLDVLPAGITPLAATITVSGSGAGFTYTIVGQTLDVKIPTLVPNVVTTLDFDAVIGAAVPSGTTLVNVATISATGVAAKTTTPASVFVGIGSEVYDGLVGAAGPVTGASVLIAYPSGTNSIVVLAGIPVMPNSLNANPFLTDASGIYAFGLGVNQYGTLQAMTHYTLVADAPGFIPRRIDMGFQPDSSGLFWNVTLHALDQQPLALPGGFALTASDVTLYSVYGFFGNIPLFKTAPIAVSKTVDRTTLAAGDVATFTVTVSDKETVDLGATTVVDTLPAGLVYGRGSARVDGSLLEPAVTGNVMTWTFPALPAGQDLTIQYAAIVLPSAPVDSTVFNRVSASSFYPGTTIPTSATAQVPVQVVGGILSEQYVITGRVVANPTLTGCCVEGGIALKNVRIYMEDGSSVLTDKDGRFSFRGVRPGEHVLRIDESSLPLGAKPYPGRFPYGDPRSLQRVIHGVYDDITMQDVYFALWAPSGAVAP